MKSDSMRAGKQQSFRLGSFGILILSMLCHGAIFDAPGETLNTDQTSIQIEQGHLKAITARETGINYLPENQPAPVLSVRVADVIHRPDRMEWDLNKARMTLNYEETGIKVVVGFQENPTHIAFELLAIDPVEKVDLIIWGPYPTTIQAIIGETVGVVRNREFAIGIQALNPKTLGGYPTTEDDIMPMYSIFDGSDYSDISVKFEDKQLYRGNTAERKEFGSVLQAYCRDRSENRTIANWGHEKYIAPAFQDGGVTGSRIALFGGPANQALETIGKIEVAENLPHPMIDGVWGKTSPSATASYLIVSFSEKNIAAAIDLTKRAGLRYLYHGGPFQTWGHFKLNPGQFPDNWASIRRCVEQARTSDVRLGVHTPSNFIKPNDPYVSPDPDPRLARIGSANLVADIDAEHDEILIATPDIFQKKTGMNTVAIGSELIRYRQVSESAPWRLLGCQRGAWDTVAAPHKEGESVSKLMDHDYRVFLSNSDLSMEIGRNIADLFNQTELLQVSFDGLEGNWSTGMGQYGRTLFTKSWYDHLKPELRGTVINDASNPGHYTWHIYTRMNWGEPWYAGFRESQTLYRLKNQAYYSRNLMPRMLGWFKMDSSTGIEDAEWLMARAAGFDAGFALVTSPQTVMKNGIGENILESIKHWETARMSGAFPADLKPKLQDIKNEFHLNPVGDERWDLHPVHSFKATHDRREQPGMITFSAFDFENPHEEQLLQFIIQSTGKSPAMDVTLEINDTHTLDLSAVLEPGQILKYTNGSEAIIYNKNWQEQDRKEIDTKALRISKGMHSIRVGYRYEGNEPALKMELRTIGKPRRIRAENATKRKVSS